MSRSQLFIFVEGGLDRSFADRMIRSTFPNKAWAHQAIGMKEFPGGTGGKPALLALFRQLRKKRQLESIAFGKKMVCVFLADKDIDDLTRRRVKSAHFLYTDTYDLEGHLFQHGVLGDAIADACAITSQQAASLIGNPTTWIQRVTAAWKEWLVLCIISHKNNVNTGSSYTRPSAINPNSVGATDPAQFQLHAQKLRQTLGMTPAQFANSFSLVEAAVERSFQTHNPLQYFKGKWLELILEKHLERSQKIPDSNFNGAGERVLSTLVSQVGTKNPCGMCSPFVNSIRQLAAALP